MFKTLADLTPEEQAECVGMWVTTSSTYTGIIMQLNSRSAYILIPEYRREETFPLTRITLRDDLPRAWQPNGTPPEGEWLTHGTHTRVIPRNRRAYVTMSEPDLGEKA